MRKEKEVDTLMKLERHRFVLSVGGVKTKCMLDVSLSILCKLTH